MLTTAEIGERIRSARTEVGMTQAQLAAEIGLPTSTVAQIEQGMVDPLPGDYVLMVAAALKVDFSALISSAEDATSAQTRNIYRMLTHPTPKDKLAIRRFMQMAQTEFDVETLLEARGQRLPPSYALPERAKWSARKQAEVAAANERQRLGLGSQPIENIFAVIRSQGCKLVRHRLDDSDLSGLTVLHPRVGVCVLVNFADDMFRQLFSAAHEYAHVLFDRDVVEREGCMVSYIAKRSDPAEVRANYFASHFLLPRSALAKYERPRDIKALPAAILEVARDYRVNAEVVVYAMHDAGWITERTVTSFQAKRPATVRKSEKADPDIPNNLTFAQQDRLAELARRGIGTNLLETLRRALVEERITIARFAEIVEIPIAEIADFITANGVAL